MRSAYPASRLRRVRPVLAQLRSGSYARFGLGARAGVGLPGESAGILAAPEDWDGRSEYAVLFGQAVSVTTVQATQVFATYSYEVAFNQLRWGRVTISIFAVPFLVAGIALVSRYLLRERTA